MQHTLETLEKLGTLLYRHTPTQLQRYHNKNTHQPQYAQKNHFYNTKQTMEPMQGKQHLYHEHDHTQKGRTQTYMVPRFPSFTQQQLHSRI